MDTPTDKTMKCVWCGNEFPYKIGRGGKIKVTCSKICYRKDLHKKTYKPKPRLKKIFIIVCERCGNNIKTPYKMVRFCRSDTDCYRLRRNEYARERKHTTGGTTQSANKLHTPRPEALNKWTSGAMRGAVQRERSIDKLIKLLENYY